MKTKVKSVYYCEYCKKYKLTTSSMLLHEKHCTLNINRHCRLCKRKTIDYRAKKPPVLNPKRVTRSFVNGGLSDTYFDTTKETGQAVKYTEYLKQIINCPWCVFSILRQNRWVFELSQFNIKEEVKDHWNKQIEEENHFI